MTANAQRLNAGTGEVPNDATLRLFFALWPAHALRAQMVSHMALWRFMPPTKPTLPDKLHLTLLFMDGVAGARLQALLRIGARVAQAEQPFELRLDQAEVWAQGGIAHLAPAHVPRQLLALCEALKLAAVNAEINCDQGPFRPHVTLARHAQAKDVPQNFAPVSSNVGELALVRSILGSGRYVVLARWRL